MVSRANCRKSLPRDEIVARGIAAHNRGVHQWQYLLKVKSGRSRTENVTKVACNMTDLFGQVVSEKARNGEDLFAFNVARIMKTQYRSRRDY
jgi:hypothetical protein